ncbi:hypothetical protein B0J13DRAFT_534824 [Dactylonectria estremocensis]|uniref:Uncharacterized protein n=1 Tax=Dactylonectria estremocensis TaxID=1079267 RepID=A0A9P9CY18_9HYPO|nr:hypothetical protein B0J13DRAFT_534824 [Dactylonectria estremocensis]
MFTSQGQSIGFRIFHSRFVADNNWVINEAAPKEPDGKCNINKFLNPDQTIQQGPASTTTAISARQPVEPAKATAVHEKAVDGKLAEEAPVEIKTTEEQPTKTAPAEEKPVEGKAVEAPVVTQAVEEKPAKTKPVEEKSVEAPVEVKPEENFLFSKFLFF